MDTLPPEPDAPVASAEALPTFPPERGPPRKSALLFVAAVVPAYVLLGSAAQVAQPVAGLLVSQVTLLVGAAVVAARGSGLRARDALRLRRPRLEHLFLAALLGAAAFFAAGALLSLTALALPASWLERFDLARSIQELPRAQRVGVWLVAALAAPPCEEIAFRGWILTALRTRHRTSTAIVASAVLFAVVHLDPVRFTAVLALGALFAWMAWRAGSVWPTVVAHVVNNALGVLIGASGSGDVDLSALRDHPREVAASGALMLALAGGAVLGLARAFRRVTPHPPPPEAALVAADGAPPGPWRWRRVPRRWRLGFVAGLALLVAIAATARSGPHPGPLPAAGDRERSRVGPGGQVPPGVDLTLRAGTPSTSDTAPRGTAGSPGDRAAGAAPRRAADRRAP